MQILRIKRSVHRYESNKMNSPDWNDGRSKERRPVEKLESHIGDFEVQITGIDETNYAGDKLQACGARLFRFALTKNRKHNRVFCSAHNVN